MDERGLLKLKEQIDAAKQESAKLKGRREYLMQELATKWQCKTVKAAEKRAEEIAAEIDDLQHQINDGLTNLERMMNENQ